MVRNMDTGFAEVTTGDVVMNDNMTSGGRMVLFYTDVVLLNSNDGNK